MATSLNPFTDMARANLDLFAPLVVEGHLRAKSLPVADRLPAPLAPSSCACGPMAWTIGFWLEERLCWFNFCPDCIQGTLRVLEASDALPAGQVFEHVDACETRPARFLPEPSDHRWQSALEDSGLSWSLQGDLDEQEFWKAVAEQLGCDNRSPRRITRYRGVPQWIQFEDIPQCACGQPMELVAQLEEDSGFAWGDAGAAYLFACPTHPHSTACTAQMA